MLHVVFIRYHLNRECRPEMEVVEERTFSSVSAYAKYLANSLKSFDEVAYVEPSGWLPTISRAQVIKSLAAFAA